KVIVGQDKIVEELLVALLSGGHCLIVGVPGLAKTLLVNTLGNILGLSFNRIQFTPDMMPSDILGCEILQDSGDGKRSFEFVKGPVFANLILADEINRTPPKTQSALLEAMQERQVTVAGRSLPLEEPFLVFATQNPIEHEGTYPLPEAQLDRFFFHLNIDYPDLEEEREIVNMTTRGATPVPSSSFQPNVVTELQRLATDIPVPEHVMDFILKLVHSTRPASDSASEHVRKYVAWGAGPRASQNLTRAAKSLALLNGEPSASVKGVERIALPVLRHRVIPNYNATGEGVTVEDIVSRVLEGME
ncbi:MAG: MoxR family ATPase, partial [Kiritimatiellaeota bacterium]|nr:MoxR family ATPase [Kiritimatiellota bacterium]